MASKNEKERQRVAQDKAQSILARLLRDDDNKYCVDCDAKGPRWASWNLGVFLCIRCAGIHRNLGVHISRVKSINLDAWTPEQVAKMVQMGNSKARAVYEAQLPDSFRRPQTDSTLETFIRAKYEHKKYVAKEWVEPPPPAPAFDIDEELRKEREARRGRTINKSTVNGGVSSVTDTYPNNALPRPVSNQPASTTIDADKVPKSPTPSGSSREGREGSIGSGSSMPIPSASKSPSADLLGLGLGLKETIESSSKHPETQQSGFSDEKEFFNQKAPEEKKNLTKTDILSLYKNVQTSQAASVPNIGMSLFGAVPPASDTVQSFSSSNMNSLAGLNFGATPQLPNMGQNGTSPFAELTDIGTGLTASVSQPVISHKPSPFAMIDPLHKTNNLGSSLINSNSTPPTSTNPFLSTAANQLSHQMGTLSFNSAPVSSDTTTVISSTGRSGIDSNTSSLFTSPKITSVNIGLDASASNINPFLTDSNTSTSANMFPAFGEISSTSASNALCAPFPAFGSNNSNSSTATATIGLSGGGFDSTDLFSLPTAPKAPAAGNTSQDLTQLWS